MRPSVVALAVLVLLVAPARAAEDGLAVSETDALRYENLTLKLRLHGAEIDRLQAQIRQRETELQAEREALDRDWRARYGVGLSDVVQDGKAFKRRAGPPEEKKP